MIPARDGARCGTRSSHSHPIQDSSNGQSLLWAPQRAGRDLTRFVLWSDGPTLPLPIVILPTNPCAHLTASASDPIDLVMGRKEVSDGTERGGDIDLNCKVREDPTDNVIILG